MAEAVTVRDSIVAYPYRIIEATRRHPLARLGASPGGAFGVKSTSQGLVFLSGRDFVTLADVRRIPPAVLCHRIFPAGERGGVPYRFRIGDRVLVDLGDTDRRRRTLSILARVAADGTLPPAEGGRRP